MDVALLQRTCEIRINFDNFKSSNSLHYIQYKYLEDTIKVPKTMLKDTFDLKKYLSAMDKYFGKTIPSRHARKKLEILEFHIEWDIKFLQNKLENIEVPRMLDESDEDFFD